MIKEKTTIYLEKDLLDAVRQTAAHSEKKEDDIFAIALRNYLGYEAVKRVWSRSDLSEEEALKLAYEELHEARQ